MLVVNQYEWHGGLYTRHTFSQSTVCTSQFISLSYTHMYRARKSCTSIVGILQSIINRAGVILEMKWILWERESVCGKACNQVMLLITVCLTWAEELLPVNKHGCHDGHHTWHTFSQFCHVKSELYLHSAESVLLSLSCLALLLVSEAVTKNRFNELSWVTSIYKQFCCEFGKLFDHKKGSIWSSNQR